MNVVEISKNRGSRGSGGSDKKFCLLHLGGKKREKVRKSRTRKPRRIENENNEKNENEKKNRKFFEY